MNFIQFRKPSESPIICTCRDNTNVYKKKLTLLIRTGSVVVLYSIYTYPYMKLLSYCCQCFWKLKSNVWFRNNNYSQIYFTSNNFLCWLCYVLLPRLELSLWLYHKLLPICLHHSPKNMRETLPWIVHAINHRSLQIIEVKVGRYMSLLRTEILYCFFNLYESNLIIYLVNK